MTNYIVLAKQVPDLSEVTGEAFDQNTGTLLRSRLEPVINTLDVKALSFANTMKGFAGNNGKIAVLTMGPEKAVDIGRYALARGADTAILLTDGKFSGADTIATANTLAKAIGKIVQEFFDGNNDYYIIAGMQSVDGDTAQVPPQVAENIGINCVAYATGVKWENQCFCFETIAAGGSKIIQVKKAPVVITVADYDRQLFKTFASERLANRKNIIKWTQKDINANRIGLAGSRTMVIQVSPAEQSRKAQKITSVSEFAQIIAQNCQNSHNSTAQKAPEHNYQLPTKRKSPFQRNFEAIPKDADDFKLLEKILSELKINNIDDITETLKADIINRSNGRFHQKSLDEMLDGIKVNTPTYPREILVIAEWDGGEISQVSYELIAEARRLADSIDGKVAVLIAGQELNLKQFYSDCFSAGSDAVYIADSSSWERLSYKSQADIIADIISKHQLGIVLFPATATGRVIAPMVSCKLDCGLTADCTSLEIRDCTKRKLTAVLIQNRPALGGNIMAKIRTKNSKIQMATVRPGVMAKLESEYSQEGEIICCDINAQLSQQQITIEKIKEQSDIKLNFNADIIISGGKGIGSKDRYRKIIAPLAEVISDKLNVAVELGASRAAVEHGIAERQRQIGQTGTSVRPALYLALGISGAVQHMAGVLNAQTILAVNNNPGAAIFKQCDYYMVADAEDIAVKLTEELKKIDNSAKQESCCG